MSLYVHLPQLVDVHTRHLVRVNVNDLHSRNAKTMTFFTLSGNSTSRKRILYAQMILCFSLCGHTQRGHL